MEVDRPAASAGDGEAARTTVGDVLDQLDDLDRQITARSRSSSADLDAVGSRVAQAISEVDALQLRFLRSVAGFEVLWQRIEKDLATGPPVTDDEVTRIADEIVACLRDHVGEASPPDSPEGDRPGALLERGDEFTDRAPS